MAQSLVQLAGHLLVQCRPTQVAAAAEVASAHGGGLVITGPSALLSARNVLEHQGFTGPVLCDADRYSGRRRVGAGRGISPGWFKRQRDLGLVPLSDSGYLAARNLLGLRSILRGTARESSTVIAMLPIAARWFATPAVCDALAHEIAAAGVPVAVAVERAGDPFAARYVLRGFLRLLRRVNVPVLLLRSDVSALGALCHGAHAAAIGTTSALRHIYPIQPPGGGYRPSGIATFLSPLLSYHNVDTIERIVKGTPEHEHLWPCLCPTCDGRVPVLDSAEDAFRHALHAQLMLRAELFRAQTRQALVSTWHEHCSHALSLHDDVTRFVPRHRPPGGLRSWLNITEDPMAAHRTVPGQPRGHEARMSPAHGDRR
ncbi:MAG TPA: hypothetical protein VFV67_11955 [Actinophytocola sp.]|uniref:hypothetical protein n=1 Tax=Actinophytocola sp. TaxID=1872138 RepID=UPI002DBB3A32|nr:hypothetical protein [Actinophytocola sp.]HEU5471360.1 hypothetical protein [Actinophytocola sp.]